jgi:peptidoglycan/xylan/chitin deacetylase (PgdA/CDA1 family)
MLVHRSLSLFLASLAALVGPVAGADDREPVPDRLVVLTFDDSVKSHFTVARPILKRYGFGATFFITEGFNFATDKTSYMTWGEIRALHDDGFEIGNHTGDHMGVTAKNIDRLGDQLRVIDRGCAAAGIPKPVSFAYPGNAIVPEAVPVLRAHGILFARRGGAPEFPYEEGRGVAYEPGQDHPLLIPTAGDARPRWTLDDFKAAVGMARDGRIAVLQFHGVPEGEHPWVDTPRERFEQYMQYLHDGGFRVIALRDLARYVDPKVVPDDPWAVIRRRIGRTGPEGKDERQDKEGPGKAVTDPP